MAAVASALEGCIPAAVSTAVSVFETGASGMDVAVGVAILLIRTHHQ